MASSMEAIQKILQETVALGISDLRERLTRVEVEIKRLDDKIDFCLSGCLPIIPPGESTRRCRAIRKLGLRRAMQAQGRS